MKIAVLGTGNVGGRLARLWVDAGHVVTAGVRQQDKELPQGVKRASVQGAVADAEVIALCLPWPAVEMTLMEAGSMAGKIVVDATNPLLADLSGLAIGRDDSGAEMVARMVKDARVVKAFNTIGAMLYGDADFGAQRADGFFCGDDAAAKSVVRTLVAEAGLNPVDVGPLRCARYLEPMAALWVDLLVKQGRPPDFAFKLLERAGKNGGKS